MNDRRFDPIGQLMSAAWAIFICAALLAIAVHLLRDIWPWLLGIAVLVLLSIAAVRLLAQRGSREW